MLLAATATLVALTLAYRLQREGPPEGRERRGPPSGPAAS